MPARVLRCPLTRTARTSDNTHRLVACRLSIHLNINLSIPSCPIQQARRPTVRPCHLPLFCSPFPSLLVFPAVAGGPTWPEGKACTHHSNGMTTCSPARVVSENRHNQASISRTPQDSMHTCARHAHIAMHSAKQHRKPGMQYRASRAVGTSRFIHAECSCRPCRGTAALDLRTQVRANAWPPP